ncbi:MAG: helix-turn-helix transcriptional regulator [Candidatus Hydrogenedentes bacterium]|nr:helix-turn-helix transcriptional regulator [Candidatus Hydrogenedentota bacterium]
MVALYADMITICVLRDHGAEEVPTGSSVETKIEELWQAVYSNLMHPWSTTELARRVGVSAPHLHRLVMRSHHTTPMRMVLRLRMEHAQELLVQQDWPLSIVSERVGYRDQFAFAVAFKRFAGVTPGQFRKRR